MVMFQKAHKDSINMEILLDRRLNLSNTLIASEIHEPTLAPCLLPLRQLRQVARAWESGNSYFLIKYLF